MEDQSSQGDKENTPDPISLKEVKEDSFQEESSKKSSKESDVRTVKVKWDHFIKMKRRQFLDDYKILTEIGRGGYGSVYRVVMKNGNILRAAKKISKNKLKDN